MGGFHEIHQIQEFKNDRHFFLTAYHINFTKELKQT